MKVSFVSFFGNYGDIFKGFSKVFTAGWLRFAQNLLFKKSALSPTQTPNSDFRIFRSTGSTVNTLRHLCCSLRRLKISN